MDIVSVKKLLHVKNLCHRLPHPFNGGQSWSLLQFIDGSCHRVKFSSSSHKRWSVDIVDTKNWVLDSTP